jgi:hypothetical protein
MGHSDTCVFYIGPAPWEPIWAHVAHGPEGAPDGGPYGPMWPTGPKHPYGCRCMRMYTYICVYIYIYNRRIELKHKMFSFQC